MSEGGVPELGGEGTASDEDVFDLDALIAERAPRKPFRFKFGGETFSLPASPDMRAFALLGTDRPEDMKEGLSLLLGPDQWARLLAIPAVFDGESLGEMMLAYQARIGVDLGESPASSS